MPLIDARTGPGRVTIAWQLAVPPPAAWRQLTDPAAIRTWLGRVVDGGLAVGRDVRLDHGDGVVSSSRVLAVDEPTRLELTWDFPEEPTSRLRVLLDAVAEGGTRLTLDHEDLGELTVDYLPGWLTHLVFLEASLRDAPLPGSAFWPLHATLARLTTAP